MTTDHAPPVATETPDQRLHRDLLAQAPGAVEALVHRYGVKIYRLALRITGNPEDAQEVSQDVLWTIVRKIGTFKGESALGSWIYRITFNAAMSRLRTAKYQRTQHDELSITGHDNDESTNVRYDIADWSDMADEHVLRSQLRKRVFSAILSLPAIYRAPAVPRTLSGKLLEIPVKRILMGQDPGKVSSRDALADPDALDWFARFARN